MKRTIKFYPNDVKLIFYQEQLKLNQNNIQVKNIIKFNFERILSKL